MTISKIKYIENLLFKSYAYKRSLQPYPNNFNGINYDIAVERYSSLLEEKIKNPIAVKLAMLETEVKNPANDLKYINENLKTLEDNKKIQELLNKVRAVEAQYPKTLALRERLIEEKRIKLMGVTPKLTGLKKNLLKLKLMV